VSSESSHLLRPRGVRTTSWAELQEVLPGVVLSGAAPTGQGVTGITLDSRQVHPGDLYVGLPGTRFHGARFASQALEAGAVAVLTDTEGAQILADSGIGGVPILAADQLRIAMAKASARIFGDPGEQMTMFGITGTNGKTTTTQMTEAILKADGLKAAAVGNIGRPILEAMADEVDYDVFAVELSSFQLHWTDSLALHSAAVLNLHEDHLEWYADHPDPFAAYGADKAKIFHGVTGSCVYNVADPATEKMVEDAEVAEGARAIGFTLGTPGPSMVGVVDDLIVDRAFIEQRATSAVELAKLTDVHPYAPHNIENALAAAALTRSFGVHPTSVGQGLRDLVLGGHRIETVHQAGGIRWVDDSKATNPHAANSSMRAFDHIVWIAGGQAKGTNFDHLVTTHRDKLRGVVVLGIDRAMIAETLARLAPQVPVVVLDSPERAVMAQAVDVAATMARPGDTVLMAPGCASLDIWPGYAARGDDFAAAARRIQGPTGTQGPAGR